jgi:hypothetical protein
VPRARTRTAVLGGVAAVVVVIVAAVAILPRLAAQPRPGLSPSASSLGAPSATPIVTPLPSGGISKERAIALAEPHKSLTTTFKSAEAGRFRELNPDPNIGPGFGVTPDRLVWAVTYEGDMTICYPSPGACESPRPGTLTVFIDYFTGEALANIGYSPP